MQQHSSNYVVKPDWPLWKATGSLKVYTQKTLGAYQRLDSIDESSVPFRRCRLVWNTKYGFTAEHATKRLTKSLLARATKDAKALAKQKANKEATREFTVDLSTYMD